ncbi:MAG: phosphatase PAP2 family protein [Minisyncoccota bacterium]
MISRRTGTYLLLVSVLVVILDLLSLAVLVPNGFVALNDLRFENLLLSIRTPFFLHVFEGITFFGSVVAVTGIAVAVGVFLAVRRLSRPYLAGFVVTISGAAVSLCAMKEIVGRARPGGLIPAFFQPGFSFPSGHATISIALYGFIAFLLLRHYPRYKRFVVLGAALLALSIGFSRLYVGVHFPSDVIAGYALGGLWLLAGMGVVRLCQSRLCI